MFGLIFELLLNLAPRLDLWIVFFTEMRELYTDLVEELLTYSLVRGDGCPDVSESLLVNGD